MAIKKLTISFDVDMEVFMKMLQHGNSSMNIQVLGDKPKVAKEPKLLAGPPTEPLRKVALDFFREHKERQVPIRELRHRCIEKGFRPNSAYQIVSLLIENKHLKKLGDGMYQITAAGVNYNG
jgi:hypothetical protein